MKALVLNALGRGFDLDEVDIASPTGREVLVDVQESGLCHTDLLFTTPAIPRPQAAKCLATFRRQACVIRTCSSPHMTSRRRLRSSAMKSPESWRPSVPAVRTPGVVD